VVPAAERAIQLGREMARVPLFYHFIAHGDVEDMERYLNADNDAAWNWSRRAFALRDAPEGLPEALAWADEAQRAGGGFAMEYARLNFLLVAGAPQDFFRVLRRIQTVDETIATVAWAPAAELHRRSEEMKRWVEDMGLPELWRERGWPDLCQPTTGEDFACE
jgi:hypothetical protein